MICSIRIKASAGGTLSQLARPDRLRLIAAIDGLAARPYAGALLKGKRRSLRRIRAGSYRFVYEVLDREVVGLVVCKGQSHAISG